MGTLGLNMSEAVVHRPVACNFVRKVFTIISIVKKARSNYFRTICREAYSEPC